MESARPAKLIDPVCGMAVDVGAAEAAGLLLEHEGRTYSDAYPEIKAQLDAERAAAAHPPVDPGICEVAEAVPATTALGTIPGQARSA